METTVCNDHDAGGRIIPPIPPISQRLAINAICHVVHDANKQWWTDLETGQPLQRNVGEMLALVHSEISDEARSWWRLRG